MMILQAFGARQIPGSLWRVQAFVLTRLIAFNHGDLRWTLAAMALRVVGSAAAFGERQLSRWARRVLRRAWQGARFATARPHADTMVAAAGR
jgi:hypothetical protein